MEAEAVAVSCLDSEDRISAPLSDPQILWPKADSGHASAAKARREKKARLLPTASPASSLFSLFQSLYSAPSSSCIRLLNPIAPLPSSIPFRYPLLSDSYYSCFWSADTARALLQMRSLVPNKIDLQRSVVLLVENPFFCFCFFISRS